MYMWKEMIYIVNETSFRPFPFLICVNHGMDGAMLTILEAHHKTFIVILTYNQHTNRKSRTNDISNEQSN